MRHRLFWHLILILAELRKMSYAIDVDDDEEFSTETYGQVLNTDNEPVKIPENRRADPIKNIECEKFSEYAFNCTTEAAIMYNSNKKSPPPPSKMDSWCDAVKYLTNCALEWNLDCRDVTDSNFNEESINGHSYVVSNICDDKNFLQQYADITDCLEATSDNWEICYTSFKTSVDGLKRNASSEWTHYETHFYLCCSRARFRRCVLDTIIGRADVCTKRHTLILQKFSVIISEGDVYQDCDFNMMYSNCPGGDPRPASDLELSQITDFQSDYTELSAAEFIQPALYCFLVWALLHLLNILL